MPARAMWKGSLELGSHKLPVKLYSAVEEHGVHFRLLDARSKQPVHQQLVDPSSDEIIPYQEAKHGFPIEDGFVLLEKEELDELKPEATREIALQGFLSSATLGPEWMIRPYYLGPDGAQASYFALAAALAKADVVGIVHWVMRGQEYAGALRAQDGYLMLFTLRSADEVVTALPQPEGRAHNDKEAKLAEQLIAAYADEFDPTQYQDEYRERVQSFIEQKAKGHKPRLKKPTNKRENAGDLSSALERSLAGLKKPAQRPRKERRVA